MFRLTDGAQNCNDFAINSPLATELPSGGAQEPEETCRVSKRSLLTQENQLLERGKITEERSMRNVQLSLLALTLCLARAIPMSAANPGVLTNPQVSHA